MVCPLAVLKDAAMFSFSELGSYGRHYICAESVTKGLEVDSFQSLLPTSLGHMTVCQEDVYSKALEAFFWVML